MKCVRVVFMIFLLAVAGVAQAQQGQGALVDVNISITGPQAALDFFHAQRSANYMAMSPPMVAKERFAVFDTGEMTPVLTVEQRFAMATAPAVVGEEMNDVFAPKGAYVYFHNGQWLACEWPKGIKPRPYPIGVCTPKEGPDST